MLVKAFNDFKEGNNLEAMADDIKKISDFKAKNRRKTIRQFDEFLNDVMNSANEPVNEMKYLTKREQFITESNNHAEKVLKKLNTDDLPEAEGLDDKNSQVGSFISADEIVEIYGDELEGILNQLGKDGLLVYCFGSGATTWWQRKKDSDDDDGGLVRVV